MSNDMMSTNCNASKLPPLSEAPPSAPPSAPTLAQSSVRAPAIIKFKRTHRAFRTKQSTLLREQVFLAKNCPYLKANHYLNTEYSNIENSDPTWFTQKGKEITFLRSMHTKLSSTMIQPTFKHTISAQNII